MRSSAGQALRRTSVGIAVVTGSFGLTSAAVHWWSPLAANGENLIHITEATYGANCRSTALHQGSANPMSSGNATVAAGQSCDETDVLCPIVVDVAKIGDPAVGCDKDFVISWRCGAERTIHRRALPAEARGRVAWLSCPATD